MTIYEALDLETTIEALAEQTGGEISEEDFALLIQAQTTELSKIENVCKYIKHLEYFAEACKAEKARLNEKQKAAENRIESIKRFLNPFIQQKGKFDAGVFKLSDRKSEAVEVLNLDAIPAEYKITKIEVSADKTAIKNAIKSGIIIAGAELHEHHNTQIK